MLICNDAKIAAIFKFTHQIETGKWESERGCVRACEYEREKERSKVTFWRRIFPPFRNPTSSSGKADMFVAKRTRKPLRFCLLPCPIKEKTYLRTVLHQRPRFMPGWKIWNVLIQTCSHSAPRTSTPPCRFLLTCVRQHLQSCRLKPGRLAGWLCIHFPSEFLYLSFCEAVTWCIRSPSKEISCLYFCYSLLFYISATVLYGRLYPKKSGFKSQNCNFVSHNCDIKSHYISSFSINRAH